MKKIIALALLMAACTTSFADSIKCYTGNRLIYSHQVRDVTYTGDMYVFTEEGTDKLVFFNGFCVVKIYV